MSQIISLVEKTTAVQIIDILIAVGIILFFRIFSSGMSYIIIKMFKFKEKKSKRNSGRIKTFFKLHAN